MLLLIAGTLIHYVSTILSRSPFQPSLIAKHRSSQRPSLRQTVSFSHHPSLHPLAPDYKWRLSATLHMYRSQLYTRTQTKQDKAVKTTKLPSCRGLVSIAALRAQVPRPSMRTANRLRHLHPHHVSLPSVSLCEIVVPRYQLFSARPLETPLKPTHPVPDI